MLIRCPTCASGYELDADLLTEGRILRCAHCRDAWAHSARLLDVWAATPQHRLANPDRKELVTEARSGRGVGKPAAPSRRSLGSVLVRLTGSRVAGPLRRHAAAIASATLLLGAIGGGMAAVAAKEHVVAAFPPSAAVFATLGLPVNLRGLALGEIRSTVETGAGASTLTLEGHITNMRPESSAVPPIRIAVRDSSQRELYYWTVPAPKPRLDVGETVLFRSRLSAPPRDGQDLVVSFAEALAPARNHVAEALAGDR